VHEGTSDAFVEALLRAADGVSASNPHEHEAIAHRSALEGHAPSPRTVSSELAAYLAMRLAVVRRDHAQLGAIARCVWPRARDHARAWLATMRGEALPDLAREQGSDALSEAWAIEALVLETAHPLEGWPREGTARELGLAREAAARASRADQPHAQYAAYLALARARRHTHRVPMATRLVGSLLRSAPETYRELLAWEAFLVGLRGERAADTDALALVIDAARRGDREAFERARATLATATAMDAPRAFEARAIVAALDPAGDLRASDPTTQAFLAGARHDLEGLEGAVIEPGAADAPIALAIVSHTGLRRVLAPGIALVGPLPRVAGSEQGGRTETAIVTLAGAPRGLDVESFFRAVYGFAFKKALHDGVLRVLLTRMRQALEPHARLVREDERLRLEVTTPFALVDPRVASRADNAVLRAIAGDRAISAKEIAERTGLPLRTVQAELGRLVDEGVCRREKDGRNTEYLVEDTVVREPSRVVAARDLAAR
jgi:DNA-binding transcriptional ArsR family regulator